MTNWIVEDRITSGVVHAYESEQPDHFTMFPLEQYNHIRQVPAAHGVEVLERNITGVQYLRRFTQAERIAIRDAAKVSPELDDYVRLLDTTIAQGGVVNLLDPDVIAAVSLLELVGLIAAGRAAEILA